MEHEIKYNIIYVHVEKNFLLQIIDKVNYSKLLKKLLEDKEFHRGVFLVNNQLDVQFFFLIRLFKFAACFGRICAHHQESQLYQYDIWYMSL